MAKLEITVAIVDDDEAVRRALRRMISTLSYQPVEFASGEAFLADPDSRLAACVLIDLHMPGLNGIDLLMRMKSQGYNVPAIIITGGDEPRTRQRCMDAGASGYLVKPVHRDAMLATIHSLSRKTSPTKPR